MKILAAKNVSFSSLVLLLFANFKQINKLTSVFHASGPVIGHEFRHNIVKIAVDPRGDSLVDPQTTLTML